MAQDSERVDRAERTLAETMRENEARPTEGGDLEARAATMAERAADLLSARAGRARMVLLDGVTVVRVTMRSRSGRRTVTAGVDPMVCLLRPALDEMPARAVPEAVAALCRSFPEDMVRIRAEVSEAARRLTSDPEAVARWRGVLAASRAKKVRTERENMVSGMLSLLSEGWTGEMLREAVDEACLRSVMTG